MQSDQRTDPFIKPVAAALADLPGIEAVALGGSRAQGTARPESDWDLGIYYRAGFEPQTLRELGFAGEVSEIGGWSKGVFNGGAWLDVDGQRIDVHYRDLNVIEAEIDRARRGEFDVEPLVFHLAGIPTYLVVAEVAIGKTISGRLPEIREYPDALRQSAAQRWAGIGDLTLTYAEHNHAAHGRVTQCLGSIAVAVTQFAHAVLAARGEWVTNEKRLLESAGLHPVDAVIAEATDEPSSLLAAVEHTRNLAQTALRAENA